MNQHNKKRRRIVLVLVGLVALFVSGVLVSGAIEKFRDAADRAT